MFAILFLTTFLTHSCWGLFPIESNTYKLNSTKITKRHIRFKNVYPTKPDEKRCTYLENNRFNEEYISKLNTNRI